MTNIVHIIKGASAVLGDQHRIISQFAALEARVAALEAAGGVSA